MHFEAAVGADHAFDRPVAEASHGQLRPGDLRHARDAAAQRSTGLQRGLDLEHGDAGWDLERTERALRKVAMREQQWPTAVQMLESLRAEITNMPGLDVQLNLLLASCFQKLADPTAEE